jgi:UDP-N-acetylglucosamine diphosphorylase/glucosamine-1-phosphate N-acetyltransferase
LPALAAIDGVPGKQELVVESAKGSLFLSPTAQTPTGVKAHRMNVIVFEDSAVRSLGVLVTMRPACDLLIGSVSLVEALQLFGEVHRVARPHLGRYFTALAGERVPLWGGPGNPRSLATPASRHTSTVLVVNARLVPTAEAIRGLRRLVEAGERGVVFRAGALVAAVLQRSKSGHDSADDTALKAMLSHPGVATGMRESPVERILAELGSRQPLNDLASDEAAFRLVEQSHEVVTAHEHALAGSLAMRLDSGHFAETQPGLFVASTAKVSSHVVVRGGPVVVGDDADLGPFTCLEGPVWIGERAIVSPHSWIRPGTAVGHDSRVGGEVQASVIEPFTNKPHDGYLGYSHVGSWVNIAAGTNTGSLKASYGPVRQHTIQADGSRQTVHTHRQFLGAVVGDLAKTSVTTSLACGARVGVAATVGGEAPEQVAAFLNLLTGGSRTTPEQAATMLDRMMARRGMAVHHADRDLLADVWAETSTIGG